MALKNVNLVYPVNNLFCKIRLISLSFACLATVSILAGCGSANGDKNAKKDSVAIDLPAPGALSKEEVQRLHNGCGAWYDSSLKNRGFNGGIVVAKKGNIVFEDYHGTAHLNGKDTITENTPFHIASVSKTFTAMAVLKLWQEGKLNMDDELVKYFPNFNYPGVTIRNLLNHRSGLPNYVHFMEKMGWDKKKYVTNEDVLNYLVTRKGEIPNIARPETHFSYCNTNYALLALLIEKVSGKKYAAFMQENIFSPLHMKNTFVFDTSMVQTVTPSYDWKGTEIGFTFLDAVYGDKNIYSTPKELLTWDRALSSKQFLGDSTLQQAYMPYSNEKPGVRNYGLGWRMNVYPSGKKMIYHNGWWHGNNAAFIRLLDEDATIIVIGNKFTRNVYHAKDMANLFGDYISGEEEEEGESNRTPVAAPAKPKQKDQKKKKR
ncbi:MAG: serine hydrolase domain-containing protein [Ferruginibacter sp.]